MNRFRPHIHVLPEDDANRQIANGFIQNIALDANVIQILAPAGGWTKTIDLLVNVHAAEMRKYVLRNLVLIMDFDNKVAERRTYIKDRIPSDLTDRVFILGVQSEPEELKRDLDRSAEEIGMSLSQDCENSTRNIWECSLLAHNKSELDRLFASIRPILFNSNLAD